MKEIFSIVSVMAAQPKYSFPNAQKVQIFERIDTYIENQAGAEQTQLRQSLDELRQHISTLQQQYPQVATEAEATTIIEAEFMEIRQAQPQRWQNLLQLKRWLNGLTAVPDLPCLASSTARSGFVPTQNGSPLCHQNSLIYLGTEKPLLLLKSRLHHLASHHRHGLSVSTRCLFSRRHALYELLCL